MRDRATKTGKKIARKAVADFIRYAADALDLISITQDSTRVVIRIRDGLRSLAVEPPSEEAALVDRAIEENAEVSEKLHRDDFSLLNGHTLMGLWGALEICIDDVALGAIKEDQAKGAHTTLARLRVPVGDFLYLDEEDRWPWLIEQIKREQNSTLKTGVGQFESLLAAIGLGGEVDPSLRKTLHLVKAVRNVLAHRGGKVDQRFQEACPDVRLPIGASLRITTEQTRSAAFAMILYVENVGTRVLGPLASQNDEYRRDDWLPASEKVLADFMGGFSSNDDGQRTQ
jgi:hypothetical protein